MAGGCCGAAACSTRCSPTRIEARMRSRVRAGVVPVAELEQLVDDAPEREHRWALLMLGLYRDGRQAEALRAFDRARTELADRFGIDPGANLVTLQRAILDQDPRLNTRGFRYRDVSRCQTTLTSRGSSSNIVGVPQNTVAVVTSLRPSRRWKRRSHSRCRTKPIHA